MKNEARSTKYETNSNTETRNELGIAYSDFGFIISDFKQLEGAL